MQLQNLYLLLKEKAESYPDKGITFYSLGKINTAGYELKYPALLYLAKENSYRIHQMCLESNTIILLHFNTHLDNLVWFWSVVCVGYIPALSTPFKSNVEQRQKHILHLHSVLDKPLCLTRRTLLPEFASQDVLRIQTIDDLPPVPKDFDGYSMRGGIFCPLDQVTLKKSGSLALLMLTSGSTGNAKAVRLTHGQILASVEGKSKAHSTRGQLPFLNWIAFDHVACVSENHLHALWVGAAQIMVQAEDIVPNPLSFLSLINRHQVAISFAPNFFPASLRRALENVDRPTLRNIIDISCLQTIVSGSEANLMETAVALTKLLKDYGASDPVCPRHDVKHNQEFASVGYSIDSMYMRITNTDGQDIGRNIVGNLEVRGAVVFSGYHNDPEATKDSFNGD
ncbi:putative thioesterase domain protein [Botrytis fragariae]|uniref:Putative thioesterase domain protein n=1 Tax=Botrytis fragariae TaxID=1964551 RepID=A0A8H6B421_9HELO|nr:putative thioesterase domain protein [Botrytis fragariae]KAF5879006.1 putative thioesterase domain protein [Botrytis fragariae]